MSAPLEAADDEDLVEVVEKHPETPSRIGEDVYVRKLEYPMASNTGIEYRFFKQTIATYWLVNQSKALLEQRS